jgi:PAS domain S-box-containing protein
MNHKHGQNTETGPDTQSMFGRLAATNGIGFLAGDFHGNLTDANDAFLSMVGYTREEFRAGSVRWGEMTPPEYVPLDAAAIAECRVSGVCTPYEKECICKDGSRLPILIGIVIYDEAREEVVCFVLDRTEDRRAEGERRQTQEALRVSEERLRDAQTRLETALSAGGIATWTWDIGGKSIAADANLPRLFALNPDDVSEGQLDVYLQAIHPEDRPSVSVAFEDALAHREAYDVEFRVRPPDGSPVRRLASRGRVERDSSGKAVALAGVVVDITERAERANRERFLADLAERARTLTNPDAVIADAVKSVGQFLGVQRCVFADIDTKADTCTVPPDYRADASVVSMAGTFPISDFGPYLVGEYDAGSIVVAEDVREDPARFPPEYVGAYEAVGIRAFVAVPVLHSSRLVSVIAVHSRTPRQWKSEEVELLKTVVERTWLTVEVARQDLALAREAEERRAAHENTMRILESITDAFFALDTGWRFSYLNDRAEEMLQRPRTDLLGKNVWEEFPAAVDAEFYRQYHRAVAEQTTVTFEDYYPPPLDTWFEVRAYPSSDGLSVYFQNVNERKRAEKELELVLMEQRARAERESLLNYIGQAIRSSLEPEAVQETAVNLLGEALGADRCYFAVYDLNRGHVKIDHDYHRMDLPSVQGVYPFANTVEMFHELYHGSNTSVIQDAFTAPLSSQTKANMEALQLRSRVSVALVDGEGLMATLTVAMAHGPRDWSNDEVALVEAIGTQLRTAVEMTRVTQREHTIATQLQDALQPDLPGMVTGLALTRHYQPALAQSEGVGGDFFDVFAVEKGCTALVVGDLSGKGLAAAAQVSTVRNMLRAFLYSRPTVSEAVTELNRVLAENNLLTGFTTLFVGVYDSATGILSYVNCGQEPALVRRADTGEVVPLDSTGPILGAIEGVQYQEFSATLRPGDAVAIFTDGLTEVGASRTEMLGIDGVAALLAEPTPLDSTQKAGQLAEALSQRLIVGVDAFAQTGARDDMCLLLGVIEDR